MEFWKEEDEIMKERALSKVHPSKKRDKLIMTKLYFFSVMLLLTLWYHKGHANEMSFTCPCCEAEIFLEVQPIEAKEIPGAGWECDNCKMFQCHGNRCAYCGAARKKK